MAWGSRDGLFEYLNQLPSGSLCLLLLGIYYSSCRRSLIPDITKGGKNIEGRVCRDLET